MVINELLEVLFYENILELRAFFLEIYCNMPITDTNKRTERIHQWLLEKIPSKEQFVRLIQQYRYKQEYIWQQQECVSCDELSQNRIRDAMKNGTAESGKKRIDLFESMLHGWATHLEDYSHKVNKNAPLHMLELATGAGLGTYGVMKNLNPNSFLTSVDIDYACIKNADGIAKYMNLENRVSGLTANFWFLPFANHTFDMVCTHYGLDECGEVPKVIQEVSRVLKTGGQFIGVCRKRPYIRHQKYMELYSITEEECGELLSQCRLFSGLDDLVDVAANHNLILQEKVEYSPDSSHERYIFTFQKQE